MQTSTKTTERKEMSGSTNTPPVKQSVTLSWTLQRLNRTWFLFEGQVLRIEKLASDGASDEQWRGFLASNGIRMKNTHSKPLGPLVRRDFLNWLENEHPDRMPQFFDSKQAALEQSKQPSSNSNDDASKDGQECERCGDRAKLQTVETKDGQQTAKLCATCIDLVIRPNTAWQVKQS